MIRIVTKKGRRVCVEEGFVHYPNGDSGKNKRNRFCEQHERDDLKVHVKKVDASKKIDQMCQNVSLLCAFPFFTATMFHSLVA